MENKPWIYVDGDACPVKDEIITIVTRNKRKTFFVSNQYLRKDCGPYVEKIVTNGNFDSADDWIAERAGKDDIVLTADILLARRCLTSHAYVLGFKGKPFTQDNIGTAVAMRELNSQLRDMNLIEGKNASFKKADKSQFKISFENLIQRIKPIDNG